SEARPAYRRSYGQSKRQAVRLAEAFAPSLPESDQPRQLFQHVALRPSAERRALINGYRRAGQDRWVVHAIGELPAAQGRAMMKDFVLTESGKRDKKALREVWLYLADIGKTIPVRKIEDDDHDSAIVEAVGDLIDSVRQAVNSVIDAVEAAVGSIGAALAAAVDFARDAMANLAQALLQAGRSIVDLVQGALANTFAFVKKMIQGILDAGKAMFDVLNAIVGFVGQALIDTLRAIDQLGHTLGELLGYLATQAFAVVKRFTEALLAIGKTIGNLLEQ